LTAASVSDVTKRTIPLRVYLVIAAGVLAVASSAIFIKQAQSEGVSSLLIAGARLILAALMLTPLVWWRYPLQIVTQKTPSSSDTAGLPVQLTRRDIGLAMASGFFLAIHFAAWVTSLEYTSVLISVVFVTTGPIWVALIEVFLLKARLHRLVGIGLGVAIVGSIIIGLGSAGGENPADAKSASDNLIGAGLSLVGAITFAAYLTIGRQLRAEIPVIPYIWMVYGSAGILLLVVILASGIPFTGYSSTVYLLLLALAIFPQLIGHSSMNYAVGYMPATVVSTISQLEPIGSAILAFIVLQESPLPVQLLGSGVILGGVLLANAGQFFQERSKRQTL
jgi:drug/metabolite transporter (DMT)-like permease